MNIKTAILITALACTSFLNVKAQQATPQWRPAYHFTPEKNWTNDPNGLMYIDGVYHLYYQHNPFENKWGHMSWGHATSTDLVHWKHLSVAIPEMVTADTTTWIFSGSAVLDKQNSSGLGTKAKPPLVAIFTADQPKQKKESQFIAYSNDGGNTFKQYAGNPVIDLQMKDFRDPNVFWYEPTKSWIMTVAMVNEHQVRIYSSKNLKQWTKLSDFGPVGFTKSGWECPFMLPLKVDNNAAKTKWVMMVSQFAPRGPMMQYFVGDFDGTTFKNDNADSTILTVDQGDAFYAAIPWRNSRNNNAVLLGWLVNGKKETYPWKGQMAIPRDLSLKTTAEGLRLVQKPAAEIQAKLNTLASKPATAISNIQLGTKVLELANAQAGNAFWIEAEINVMAAQKVVFALAKNKAGDKSINVGYDAAKGEVFVDCTTSEKDNKSAQNLVQTIPVKLNNNMLKLQILFDRSSLEVFTGDGEQALSTMVYPDDDATGASVSSDGKAIIKTIKTWNLNGLHR